MLSSLACMFSHPFFCFKGLCETVLCQPCLYGNQGQSRAMGWRSAGIRNSDSSSIQQCLGSYFRGKCSWMAVLLLHWYGGPQMRMLTASCISGLSDSVTIKTRSETDGDFGSQTADSFPPVWISRVPSPFVVPWIWLELLGFMRCIGWIADWG